MEHFIKRLSACIIDFIVVFLFISIINNILFVPLSLLKIPVISSYYPYVVTVGVTLAYFTIMEAKTNKTIGKMVMGLYVSDEEGYISYFSAFVRNITKCFWIPLVFDVLIGKILGFPSRLFDKLAGTDVYADDELEVYDENKIDEPESTQKIESTSVMVIDEKLEDKFNQDSKTAEEVVEKSAEVSKQESEKTVKSVKKDSPSKEVSTEDEIIIDTTSEDDESKDIKVKEVSEAKADEPEVLFADDSDIDSTYHKLNKKEDAKTTKKSNPKSTKKQEDTAETTENNNDKKSEEPYEDEILDLIIEEEEGSDSFVELTKDDF
ncbi:MAG TPA: hypothetical protein DCL29_04600 [Eubacterium sp.]|jgi:uncharacterized RDD family membrane protein YckC|nr:MAG: hypothetical protein BZ133_06970 [Methanosphaera sp. SHI613]HAH18272.1 hypothetical protein [Eubacterium sp.]